MKFEVKLLTRAEIDDEKWNGLLGKSKQKSVFVEPWFMDVLTQNNWQALVALNDVEYLGAMPLYNTRKLRFTLSRQPIFSKYWGVITPHREPIFKDLHGAKQITQAILSACDNYLTVVDYMMSPWATYPQQALWNDFELVPMFTYQLRIDDIDAVRGGYSKDVRRRIRKIEASRYVMVEENSAKCVMDALVANREDGKRIVDSTLDGVLKAIIDKALELERGRVFSIVSSEGETACSGFLIYDATTVHYLAGYTHPKFRQEGVMNKWVDHVLQTFSETHQLFDFFGSSMESIEAFFRSFGPEPHVYFRIRKSRFPFNLK